jgi:hypothetical protein
VRRLLAIDSLFMDDTHRKKIADACEKREEWRIIVTHGTDTMAHDGTGGRASQAAEGHRVHRGDGPVRA